MTIYRYRFTLVLLLSLLFGCQSAPPATVPPAELEPTVALATDTPQSTSPPPSTATPPATVAPVNEETPVAEAEPAADVAETAAAPTVSLATQITFEAVASGLSQPLYLTHAGDERLFVVERGGRILILVNGEVQATPFLDIEDRVLDSSNEQGLLGLAFHPDFRTNQRLFVYYTDAAGAVVVSEFGATADLQTALPDSERNLLTVAQPFRNHNGGALEFGPDGYLYIGLGDGGSANDPEYNGLDRGTLLGAVLRIDIDSSVEPYGIPSDNPFLGDDAARAEIWAYGLRNPWRISFDSVTNDLFIADVGQNEWEEVSWQAGDSAGGLNYGWNAWEGSHCFTDECNTIVDATPPIIEYSHADGCSITGGYLYRGAQSPALYGNYVYGDFCSGNVWVAIPDEAGWQTSLVIDTDFFIASFGVDVNNELYLLDYNGVVYQISAE